MLKLIAFGVSAYMAVMVLIKASMILFENPTVWSSADVLVISLACYIITNLLIAMSSSDNSGGNDKNGKDERPVGLANQEG
jgi:hypothetical protein